jgi:hypothetical protein
VKSRERATSAPSTSRATISAYGQIYGIFLFSELCRAFQQDLALSKSFMKKLGAIDARVAEVLRWPEAVTFEEMNQKEPSWWLKSALKFAHQQGWDKRTTTQKFA